MIQQKVQNPLAKELLSGGFPEGSRVKIEFDQDEFIFEKIEERETVPPVQL